MPQSQKWERHCRQRIYQTARKEEAIAKAQPGMPPKSFLTETPTLLYRQHVNRKCLRCHRSAQDITRKVKRLTHRNDFIWLVKSIVSIRVIAMICHAFHTLEQMFFS